jgi:DNA primase
MPKDYTFILDAIRAAVPLEEVVEEYLGEMRRSGTSLWAKCPFHEEKTASFHVHSGKQIYKCFGCGKGGDVIRFVMDYQRIGFVDAVQLLGQRAGIQVGFSREEVERQRQRKGLCEVMEAATSFYQHNFPGSPAEEYILGRGISQESVVDFRLGYSQDSWDSLMNYLNQNGHDSSLIEKLGLIRQSEKSQGRYFDFFRNRIMFPITDSSGFVMGFGARAIGKPGEGVPKYLNSPKTPLFDKGHVLYGLDKALQPITKEKQAIIVEGYTDVIMAAQAGIENVIGTGATVNLTEKQIEILTKRFPDSEVLLVGDGDEAGVRAILAAGRNLIGKKRTYVFLPSQGEDPASLIEKGVDFKEEIKNKVPFFDFYLGRVAESLDLQTFEGKQSLLEKLAGDIYPNVPVHLRGIFLDSLIEKTGITREAAVDFFSGHDFRGKDEDKDGYWENRLLGELGAASVETRKFIASLLESATFSNPARRAIAIYLSDPRTSLFEFYNSSKEDFFSGEHIVEDVARSVQLRAQEEGLEVESNAIKSLIDNIRKYGNPNLPLEALEHSLIMLESVKLREGIEIAVRKEELGGVNAGDLLQRLRKLKGNIRSKE